MTPAPPPDHESTRCDNTDHRGLRYLLEHFGTVDLAHLDAWAGADVQALAFLVRSLSDENRRRALGHHDRDPLGVFASGIAVGLAMALAFAFLMFLLFSRPGRP